MACPLMFYAYQRVHWPVPTPPFSVRLALDANDFSMVDQPVQQRRHTGPAGEHIVPVCNGLIGGE